jgi:hypothetical protein
MTITIEELRQVFPTIESIKLILTKKLIDGLEVEELIEFDSNIKWILKCYNYPQKIELTMNAINEMLEGFGVESIIVENYHVDNFWRNTIGLYVNMGETYASTIVYDVENKEYQLTSWGDFYESIEKKEYS